MKRIFVIICPFLVYAQAASGPIDYQKRAEKALPECASDKNLDLNKMQGLLKQMALPEDNAEFIDFMTCYYGKMGVLKEDGELNINVVPVALPQLIKHLFGSGVDAQKLAGEAAGACASVIQGSLDTANTIRFRNCAIKYVQEHEK